MPAGRRAILFLAVSPSFSSSPPAFPRHSSSLLCSPSLFPLNFNGNNRNTKVFRTLKTKEKQQHTYKKEKCQKSKVITKCFRSHISYSNKGIRSLRRWAVWLQAACAQPFLCVSPMSEMLLFSHTEDFVLQFSSRALTCRLWPDSIGDHTQWDGKSLTGQGCHQVREGAILELLVSKHKGHPLRQVLPLSRGCLRR